MIIKRLVNTRPYILEEEILSRMEELIRDYDLELDFLLSSFKKITKDLSNAMSIDLESIWISNDASWSELVKERHNEVVEFLMTEMPTRFFYILDEGNSYQYSKDYKREFDMYLQALEFVVA